MQLVIDQSVLIFAYLFPLEPRLQVRSQGRE
ncbi:hypothetical protein BJB45_01415 [Halomonas huangheensis]|uniref:Uncharacterized protein n=1 Tax=Halomonas huangheensis TaxID=1178482 RepID=W1N3U3_9GAMM|nr:hypothetical protein BJB45_01415 [Halomonas huangheensis]